MNRKQFIILLVLVVVIGGAGLMVHQRNRQSWQSADATIGQKLLPQLAVNDIAQIHIQSGTNELVLAKRNERWCVTERNDYPADFSKISGLLLKLADLKVVQNEPIGPSQLGRLQLLAPGSGTNAATLLEFKDTSGKTLGALLLGKEHLSQPAANSQFGGAGGEGWPDGRYVMAGAGAKTVAVISDPLASVQPQPQPWLDPEFLSIEKPRSIEVQFPEATNSWTLTRASETNDWQLAYARPGEKLDAAKISSVTSPFSSVRFTDVTPLKPGPATRSTQLTVKTWDGFTYHASIAPEADGNYPVNFTITASLPAERPAAKGEKPADQAARDKEFKAQQARLTEKLTKEQSFTNWVYLLPAYAVDPLLKTREQLLLEPKKETKTAATP